MQNNEHTIHAVGMKQYRDDKNILTKSDSEEKVNEKSIQKKCNFVITQSDYSKLAGGLKTTLNKLVEKHSKAIKTEGKTFGSNVQRLVEDVNAQLKQITMEKDKIGKKLNTSATLLEKSISSLQANKNPSENTIKEYVENGKNTIGLLRSELSVMTSDVKKITNLVDEFDRKISALGSKKKQDELSIDTATGLIDVSSINIHGKLHETSGSPFNKKTVILDGLLTKINTKTKEYTILANGRPYVVKKICVE